MMRAEEATNFVLHAKSNEFYWDGNGQLSIKTFTNGRALYKTNRGFFAVEENRYLLLNEGPYTISIEENEEVESFCLFFGTKFADDVYRAFIEPTNKLLTDPFDNTDSVSFFEKTYVATPSLAKQLTTFKKSHMQFGRDSCWHDEQFHAIMHTLIKEQTTTLKEVESLHAIRKSTREELFQRVTVAHEYIRAFFEQPIQLSNIADAACLSTNHLLRSYAQLYGKTPHQHITALRMQKAKILLENLELTMTDISFEVGFLNPVSFSRMFKQHTGLSPLHYRKKVILDKKSF